MFIITPDDFDHFIQDIQEQAEVAGENENDESE